MSIGRVKVMFVCYGNICRSPTAEFAFRKILDENGLSERFEVASSGTSGEHIGDPPDARAAAVLRRHGISCEGKRSRRLLVSDFLEWDYVIGMDRRNMEYIRRVCPPDRACEIGMLMDYAGGGEIADPYYTGDFETAYEDIRRGCLALLKSILREHPEVARWRTSGCSSRSPSRTPASSAPSAGSSAPRARGRARPSRRTSPCAS